MEDNQQWRDRLKALGKETYEIEEMVRMGFLKISQEELEQINENQKEFQKLLSRGRDIETELKGLEDITPYIKIIREERIARVKCEREEKRIKKEQLELQRKKEVADRQRSRPTYLGDEISASINYDTLEEPKEMAYGLPAIEDLDQLAAITEISAKNWQWLAYHRKVSDVDHYNRFTIPKKSGGERKISSPKGQLRLAQKWIADTLLSKVPLHASAVAYRKGMSIADNALQHKDSALVIRMDLKDFFPSIQIQRVRGVFKQLGYNDALSTIFASVCTDAERIQVQVGDKKKHVALGTKVIPQGTCTSPSLTNILCRKLDKRMCNFAQKRGMVYTRYADDLVFSSKTDDLNIKSFISWVRKIIKDEGFVLNEQKTHVMRSHQRQTVTGIVVNSDHQIRISRKDIRQFRAFVHRLHKIGEDAMMRELGKMPYSYLKGYWSFINMVNKEQAQQMKLYIEKLHPRKIKF